MSARLDEIKARCEKATKGPWTALADGNQYLDTKYMPTAKCVASARVLGIQRPWNPHALLSFGFTPGEYETARFAEHDAAFIASAREDVPWLVSEVERLRSGLMLVASIVESSETDDADVLVIVGREARAVLNGDVR